MIRTFIMAAALCLAVADQGWAKTVIARGPIGVGTTDSVIDDLRWGCCAFLTDSRIAKTIFSKCGFLDECEAIGTVEKLQGIEAYFFTSISRVRKIDPAKEPPSSAIKSAACSAFSLDDETCKGIHGYLSIIITSMKRMHAPRAPEWIITLKVKHREAGSSRVTSLGTRTIRMFKHYNNWTYRLASPQ